jgi:hypothetical protein
MSKWLLAVCLLAAVPSDGGSELAIPPLSAAVSAESQIIAIDGPDEVQTGKPAWYRVGFVPEGSTAEFMPTPLLDTDSSRVVAGNALFWVSEPGVYVLTATVIDWDAKRQTWLSKQVTVGESPEPEPDPDPEPQPTPDKATWGIIVEERSDRTQLPIQQRYIFESAAIRELFPAGKFLTVDRNSTDPAMKPYCEKAASMTLPVLFLMDDDGTVVFSGTLPNDVTATIVTISKHRGE